MATSLLPNRLLNRYNSTMTPRLSANALFLTAALPLFASLCAHAQTPPAPPAAQTKPAVNATAVYARPVAKGVSLTQEVIPDGTHRMAPTSSPSLRIDPKVAGVHFEAALGGDKVWGTDPTLGREIVSTLAARHNAVAGVNAGFFPFMGNPLGLHIQNGEVVTEPIKNRTTFFVDKNGVPHIGAWTYSGMVRNTKTGESIAISGLNRKAKHEGRRTCSFTRRYFLTKPCGRRDERKRF